MNPRPLHLLAVIEKEMDDLGLVDPSFFLDTSIEKKAPVDSVKQEAHSMSYLS